MSWHVIHFIYGSMFPSDSLRVRTKLFSWIHGDGRKQAETLRLSSELLEFLWLDLPPSAEQVQAQPAIGAEVEVHHQTVCARRPQDAEGVVEVVEADAAAVQRDVGVDSLTRVPEAEMTVNGKSISVVHEDDVGRVSPFEPLPVRLTAQASCNQHPFAEQMMDVHRIHGPQQVVAGHRGRLAQRQGAKKKSGTQDKHLSGWKLLLCH